MANKIMKVVTQDHYGPDGIDYRVGQRFAENHSLPETVLFTYVVVADPEPGPQSYPAESGAFATGEPPKRAGGVRRPVS